ncbi:hypothetical protein [Pseudoalteromonas luteoviolacea]|uniref:hypothetical protein n=1 Tax=Pseudoalteromonas luteoviolacea TaxID=43657 RepID=UPI001B370DAE|nr:hypothetical protein [Pseudoalteromonas luteoviolacea]MBQ4839261.1 hypothetical protein [Pseudoalteromonas luteoviolacea]
MTFKQSICTLAALLLSACQSHSQPQSQLALLQTVTPSIVAEIGSAVVALKGGTAPTLAHNVFTQSPQLILTQGQSNGGMENTALSALPISTFELQLRSNTCVLYYPKANKFVPLHYATCTPYIDTSK